MLHQWCGSRFPAAEHFDICINNFTREAGATLIHRYHRICSNTSKTFKSSFPFWPNSPSGCRHRDRSEPGAGGEGPWTIRCCPLPGCSFPGPAWALLPLPLLAWNHRNIAALKLEKTCKITKFDCELPAPPLHHFSKHHVYICFWISCRAGDPITSPGILFQCLTTFSVNIFFPNI